MARKFLTVFGLILLYMFIWALLLLPVALMLRNGIDAAAILLVIEIVLIFALFVPYLNVAIRRTFYFPGEGTAVPAAELRQTLLSINGFDAPVMVEERKGKLVFTWRYVAARWWELLAKAGLTKIYECHVKLLEDKKTAILIDVTKSVSWRVGPDSVRVGLSGSRGVDFSYELGKMWGIKENFRPGMVYDFRFTPGEIKNPVLNTILRSGWDVRFGMW